MDNKINSSLIFSLQNVANRRPTKFVFENPLEKTAFEPPERRESSDYITSPEYDDYADKKKSVAFDDNVEKMHIYENDRNNSEGSDEEGEDSEEDIENQTGSGEGSEDNLRDNKTL